jgi:hypothetical protein
MTHLKQATKLGKSARIWATGIERCVAKSARLPVPHAEAVAKKPASVRPSAASSILKQHDQIEASDQA